jgi:hypothetical protein
MKETIKKAIKFISSIIADEKGNGSSKRVVGILCALSLCLTMYHNSFSEEHIAPSAVLVDAVALLAFGCLGLTSIDKFSLKKSKEEEPSV